MHHAALHAQADCVLLLADSEPAALTVADKLQCMPVDYLALQGSAKAIMQMRDAFINHANGRSILHEAARLGCLQVDLPLLPNKEFCHAAYQHIARPCRCSSGLCSPLLHLQQPPGIASKSKCILASDSCPWQTDPGRLLA